MKKLCFCLLISLVTPAAAQTFPPRAVPITISATGTTAVVTATLPANAAMTTYICGFAIDATATAGVAGNSTITGTISGTMNFTQGVGTAPVVAALNRSFNPCIPGSSINTALVISSIAAGTAGVTSVTAWGFQLP